MIHQEFKHIRLISDNRQWSDDSVQKTYQMRKRWNSMKMNTFACTAICNQDWKWMNLWKIVSTFAFWPPTVDSGEVDLDGKQGQWIMTLPAMCH